MDYPAAVIEKAQRLEELLKQVEGGASLQEANRELELQVTEKRRAQLQAKWEAAGRDWKALLDGRFGHHQQVTSAIREWIYQRKRENEYLLAKDLVGMVDDHWDVQVSEGHVNWLLRQVGLTGPAGVSAKARRRQAEQAQAEPEPDPSEPESRPQAGLFFPGSG